MKKIEKTFWVSDDAVKYITGEKNSVYFSPGVTSRQDEIHCKKITISCEVPEKKIELTESQFDECMDKCFKQLSVDEEDRIYELKQKLFGEVKR